MKIAIVIREGDRVSAFSEPRHAEEYAGRHDAVVIYDVEVQEKVPEEAAQ
jgi:hypothetical protein